MIGRALVVWVLIIVVESLHGVLRSMYLAPLFGDFRARQVGVFIGSLLIVGIAYLTIPWVRPTSERALVEIGALWLVLTLLFEFGLGLALGRPWNEALADYDLNRGGLLSIGMVVLALSPWIAARIRQSS